MAQLPPKIPNMTPNWPGFSHQKVPSIASFSPNITTNNTANTTSQNPSWVDEFLDFSAARRGAHRRSFSDSITFLEAPMLDECRGGGGGSDVPPQRSGGDNEFDRFDDEQFMSMFTDEINAPAAAAMPPPVSSSNPSTPSDHNSINDDKETKNEGHQNQHQQQPQKQVQKDEQEQKQLKNENEEVESQCKTETEARINTIDTDSNERITDPKRVKRILANRQSAQRSRVRKLQYISELERNVTSLQAEVSVLSPRVAFLDHQRLLLNVDNSALKQRIAALAQDKIFKDAHQEALKREIERLRQVYHQQNLKKMGNGAPSPLSSPRPPSDAKREKEQILNV
ncbi:Basic-leucine zipper transcription factor [Quillaja saponaria]|uniref:Basic-leucine zipper transcription factor n=1 Tax=Quillaja saponaria TaxID=32244 RepID=A0AAD7KYU4_QUISA|nr:Basic-leucine zipper transcription factor [Quillaja saponaria]